MRPDNGGDPVFRPKRALLLLLPAAVLTIVVVLALRGSGNGYDWELINLIRFICMTVAVAAVLAVPIALAIKNRRRPSFAPAAGSSAQENDRCGNKKHRDLERKLTQLAEACESRDAELASLRREVQELRRQKRDLEQTGTRAKNADLKAAAREQHARDAKAEADRLAEESRKQLAAAPGWERQVSALTAEKNSLTQQLEQQRAENRRLQEKTGNVEQVLRNARGHLAQLDAELESSRAEGARAVQRELDLRHERQMLGDCLSSLVAALDKFIKVEFSPGIAFGVLTEGEIEKLSQQVQAEIASLLDARFQAGRNEALTISTAELCQLKARSAAFEADLDRTRVELCDLSRKLEESCRMLAHVESERTREAQVHSGQLAELTSALSSASASLAALEAETPPAARLVAPLRAALESSDRQELFSFLSSHGLDCAKLAWTDEEAGDACLMAAYHLGKKSVPAWIRYLQGSLEDSDDSEEDPGSLGFQAHRQNVTAVWFLARVLEAHYAVDWACMLPKELRDLVISECQSSFFRILLGCYVFAPPGEEGRHDHPWHAFRSLVNDGAFSQEIRDNISPQALNCLVELAEKPEDQARLVCNSPAVLAAAKALDRLVQERLSQPYVPPKGDLHNWILRRRIVLQNGGNVFDEARRQADVWFYLRPQTARRILMAAIADPGKTGKAIRADVHYDPALMLLFLDLSRKNWRRLGLDRGSVLFFAPFLFDAISGLRYPAEPAIKEKVPPWADPFSELPLHFVSEHGGKEAMAQVLRVVQDHASRVANLVHSYHATYSIALNKAGAMP